MRENRKMKIMQFCFKMNTSTEFTVTFIFIVLDVANYSVHLSCALEVAFSIQTYREIHIKIWQLNWSISYAKRTGIQIMISIKLPGSSMNERAICYTRQLFCISVSFILNIVISKVIKNYSKISLLGAELKRKKLFWKSKC